VYNGSADSQPQPKRLQNRRLAPGPGPAASTVSVGPPSTTTPAAPATQNLPDNRTRTALTRSAAARTGSILRWQSNDTGESVTGAPVEIATPAQADAIEAKAASKVDGTSTSEPDAPPSRKRNHIATSEEDDEDDNLSQTRTTKTACITGPLSHHIHLDARQTSLDTTAPNIARQHSFERPIEESIEEEPGEQVERPAEGPVEQPVDEEAEEERLRSLRHSISDINM
jgi:hypothetical protein